MAMGSDSNVARADDGAVLGGDASLPAPAPQVEINHAIRGCDDGVIPSGESFSKGRRIPGGDEGDARSRKAQVSCSSLCPNRG